MYKIYFVTLNLVQPFPRIFLLDFSHPEHNQGLKDCPIVFCTSSVMRGDREKALEAGAVAYIEKPIIPEMFIEEIEKVLQ